MKNTKKKILSLLFFLSLFFWQSFVFTNTGLAESLWEKQQGMGTDSGEVGRVFGQTGEPEDVQVFIVDVILVVLTFLAIIFVILILLAVYKWMTSQGNSDLVQEAKTSLKNAVIGLIIILASYGITKFVIREVVIASGD